MLLDPQSAELNEDLSLEINQPETSITAENRLRGAREKVQNNTKSGKFGHEERCS